MSAEPLSATAPIEHKLPEGWREVPLSSVAEIRFSGVNKLSLPSEKPVRLCNYTDVYNNDYITGDLEFMRATATQPEINRFGLQLGDVIITKDSETPDDIGIAAVVDCTAPDLLCGYHLALIRPRTEEVDPTFLAKQLRHHRLARYFGQQANGLTRYGLPTAVVANAPLWLPEPVKQRAIGAYLRLVDEAIAKTEAVIAKLKQVRAGLLHDLLTRGLDENGDLRDPVNHPEQFQDSRLGRIPRDWELRPFSEIVSSAADGPFGSNLKTQHYVSEPGVRVVRLQNIESGYFDDTDKAYTSAEHAETLKRHEVLPGDLLVAALGDANHPPARACLYPSHLPPAINKADCFRLRANPRLAANGFVMLFLNCPTTRKEVNLLGQGMTRDRVNLTKLLSLQVPRPPIDEQFRIVEAVALLDSQIHGDEQKRFKLSLMKSGLMSDLLTGRVRVPEGLA